MRLVVSGTHASGKSSLIADFAAVHPAYTVWGDPYEDLDTDWAETGSGLFVAQLEVAAERLLDPDFGVDVIAERGPLDFLAYLRALDDLGRADTSSAFEAGVQRTIEAMQTVDLLVLLPLVDDIDVHDDEDPDLRVAMDEALRLLSDDPDLTGTATVVEIVGDPAVRLERLQEAILRSTL